MPGKTFSSLLIHVVFSTKERAPVFEPEMIEKLGAYVQGVLRNHGSVLLQLGGVADHVHVLMSLPPALSVSRAVKEIKGSSSHWLNETFFDGSFRWQAGYAAFSVSQSNLETVRRYISKQPEHHRDRDFEQEMSALRRRHPTPVAMRAPEGGP